VKGKAYRVREAEVRLVITHHVSGMPRAWLHCWSSVITDPRVFFPLLYRVKTWMSNLIENIYRSITRIAVI